jgi:mitogen-activated protein kinase 15
VESPLAMNILDNINISKKKGYQTFFPGASDEAIDLIRGLLKFSPLERLTAERAL